ncbi:hypothetical protein AB0B25_27100 [Nocardia sp. NPDC049190]|uniref:hypothetical protein n=1 Tax=Nocardia sp. NPDC049190 TaxID=3155650 RepID=UPI00340FE5F5
MAAGIPAPVISAAVAARGAGIAGQTHGPLAEGPFAAAVHTAKDRQALPSLVVGGQVNDDLVLARTLLAATLAAVADSSHGLEWAVAVGRTPGGPVVMLTSTEGRGWLPPGLFLPSEVNLPWRRDSILGAAGREAFAALEGTADPARILAEFGMMAGRRRRVRISALVSSAAISDGARAAIADDAAVEGWVSSAECAVDFTAPGVGLVDRLALAGSDELLRQAETVPEREIRAKCLELARVADARVRAAVSGIDWETATRRARRQHILDALHAGQHIPASWWDQIRAADNTMASALLSRQVDVSYVPVGGIRPDVSGREAIRGKVFERRADELLLLLAVDAPDRQTLRDAFYAYGQIVEHPQLPAAAGVLTSEMTRIGRAAVPDVEVSRSVGPGSHGVGAPGFGGGSPSVAELLKGPAGSGGPAK